MNQTRTSNKSPQRTTADLLFVGLNSKVIALDRYNGEIAWEWKSPEGSGYVFLLFDGDRLIVSVMGYMYCLDPLFGQEVWRNPLKGFGVGVVSLASVQGNNSVGTAANSQQEQHVAAALMASSN